MHSMGIGMQPRFCPTALPMEKVWNCQVCVPQTPGFASGLALCFIAVEPGIITRADEHDDAAACLCND
eukprot:scaffold53438_cov21-Tisochrysis_lutea.AAC.1